MVPIYEQMKLSERIDGDGPLFYYGMQVPDLDKTRSLGQRSVVLQSYHPIVRQGLYSDYFPSCRKFLYLNVSQIHRNELVEISENRDFTFGLDIKSLKYNPKWETFTLDLHNTNCHELIFNKAKKTLEIEGVDGLFLDDVDFWTSDSHLRKGFLTLLKRIEQLRPGRCKFILNRGEVFWHKIYNLDSIILENISPILAYTVTESDLAWYENLLKINFTLLRRSNPDVSVYGLKYLGFEDDVGFDRDFDLASRRDKLFEQLNKQIKMTVKFKKDFDVWPDYLT